MAFIRLPIQIAENSREPIYHQIEQQVIAFIVSGQLKAGTPLPSMRALASDLACSIITTRKAYLNLEQQGYIKTVQGKGTFVCEVQTNEKARVAQSTLEAAFRSAIELSFRMNHDKAQTAELFAQVLDKMTQERSEGHDEQSGE